MPESVGWGFWDFFLKAVSWVLASEEEVWISGLAETIPVVCVWVPHVVVVVVGQMEKSAEKDCASLSSCWITFNSKVIKSFVPEPISWMSCISDSYICLWTFYKHYTRCPWCNSYRRRTWTLWHEFKSWTRPIAFHIALIP